MKPIFLGLLLATLISGPAPAQDAMEGAALFERNCAACHGARADGMGPLAPVLTIQPTDLTALSANNGGSFPLARVLARIDGRDPLVAHGSPMPVFGPYLDSDRDVPIQSETGPAMMVPEPVADLVTWLLTVQN